MIHQSFSSKGASGIRGNVKVLIGHADFGSCLKENGATVDLIPVGDATCHHINEHVVFCLIESGLSMLVETWSGRFSTKS